MEKQYINEIIMDELDIKTKRNINKVVAEIIDELYSRKGFDAIFDSLDDSIDKEIEESLKEIIYNRLFK